MYAILFDLDTNCLAENHKEQPYYDVYKLIKDFMLKNGFIYKQGGIYFGNESINAVACVLTIQKLTKLYPWFPTCVKDVRMLRIEENNDLFPGIQ